ncbi:YceI family protein [Brevundimonas sp. NIBR11]|uniref:YceI family protein n=1 Tax=Brevundimonas sp. NIBR11 TaxID=3015999 RepID=UPI0022F10C31|nr:YceI family protein [Brevundimonas sp. NIBR11]WGM30132.1 Protein YceI [Brevundimonas sp. NIBR11]
MLNRRLLARTAVAGALVLSLVGGVVTAQTAATRNPAEVQAGTYKLDPAHGKITWSVEHLGFSTYYGQFINVAADLTLDPANPSASTLTATVPLTDVAPNNDALKAHLQTPDFFDTARFPTAAFVATSIVIDEDDASEAEVTGNLTLHGVTKPVVLDVEFNQAGPSMGGVYKVGFDGETIIKRSEFGINFGLPAIGDEVELHIEGEFIKQP